MEILLPKAKAEIESGRSGVFVPVAYLRLPDSGLTKIEMPWRNQMEKEAMAAALRDTVRHFQPLCYVVVTDAYFARVEQSKEAEWRQRYGLPSKDPKRIEALMFYLWWQGDGNDIRYFPYERIREGGTERIVWGEPASYVDEGGRVAGSIFSPNRGVGN